MTRHEKAFSISKYISDRPIILLFVKAPIKGQVKSRLAVAIGEEAALELYKRFILDSVDTVEKSGYPLRICFYPPDNNDILLSLIGQSHRIMPQEGADLGERMENAFKRIFSEGFTHAILIGSDIPDLMPVVFREALGSLKENDVVIGPAADGGYYLIGFTQYSFLPRVFHDIVWSTNRVFNETMEVLREASLRIHLAPRWKDVDTVEDLKALAVRNRETAFGKSRTMAYLREKSIIMGHATS